MTGMADERTFVIVGAGLAGAKAVETLRAEGFTGRIVLVGEETERPYERPPLSKGYLLGKDARDVAFVHDATWYGEHDIELVLGVRATDLSLDRHTVTLDGVEPLRYDKVLLATGSRVRTLDVPGADLSGVRYLRTLTEADALLDQVRKGGRVVVVGAGWIGLETAAAARRYGADVTVVEMDSRRVLGDEVARVFADLHRANGVEFRFDSQVDQLLGSGGRLTSVRLTDGTELPADLAVLGIGIRPNTELAEAAGLAVDNGVVVDAALRTSDPDVYACGDVANVDSPLLGRRIRVEHWANALDGGPAAARAMLGQDERYDRVPYFYTDQYESAPAIGMEYSGYVEPGGYDQVVFRGDPTVRPDASPEFIAFWLREGRVLAGMNVNVWDVQDPIQALVRAGHSGKSVDPAGLADPDVPLDTLLG
jgi:3-phenylpropionate/trans-cinnamate dioxygenase ferredoxin reductase subunit